MGKTFLALGFVLCLAGSAAAETPLDGHPNLDAAGRVAPAVDALLLRPLGLVATLTGVALFIGIAPVVLITRPGQLDETFDHLVAAPARYTWVDRIGRHPESGF